MGETSWSLVENHPLFVVCLLALVCKETGVRVANIECSTRSVRLDVKEVDDMVCRVTHNASFLQDVSHLLMACSPIGRSCNLQQKFLQRAMS